ncbi:MAG: bifunctional DNA-formamidopyrimidine glycosylase/DNA-(apurinic or apyrimidinic site) lyase [Candidatus Eremiobacteraeota bacterium]|nr:bifunctional DNA-formamidopyrimidine glycosylase/DNA-(apurinic or apyrimidinic site) lyase [Candidatus Eremiobacteraeota bacterium]MBV9057205.1 bifunctional DNA-formamidopyrimidine glycosylase/DNA-(apurinic or apyrimidinic site) lyase [Candidatus Eremiobacteraeota bacterium]
MPELPEVETIVRGLRSRIVGATIERATVRLARMAVAPPRTQFAAAIGGERVVGVQRRGKYVVIQLSSGRLIVTSLRMTGRLIVARRGAPEGPATHLVVHLAGGAELRFSDVRTFGRMRLVERESPWDASLGIEPLSADFTEQAFAGMLAGRTTPIKVLLLDQRRIAGIGNIYACEALWEARIRPSRAARALTKPAITRLHGAIVDVLQRAIASRGTSVDDYVDAEGQRGSFQNDLAVYGRAAQPCRRCSTGRIERSVLGQRGTWWCRRCQR